MVGCNGPARPVSQGQRGTWHVIAGICMNPRTLGDDDMRERAFAALRDPEYPAKRRASFAVCMAKNPAADDKTLDYLNATSRDYAVKRAIAYSPNAHDATLAATVRSCKDETVKQAALKNPDCGEETIRSVVETSVDPYTKRDAIGNERCPGDLADKAAQSDDSFMIEAAAANPNLGPTGVDAIRAKAEQNDYLRRKAAANPQMDIPTLVTWLDKNDPETDLGIAHNPNTTPAMLARLVAHHKGRARQGNYTSTICAHIADNQFAGLETRRMAARFAGLNWPDAKSNTLHGLSNPRQYWADRGRSQYSFSGEDDLA